MAYLIELVICLLIYSISSLSALEGQNICYGYKLEAMSVKISETEHQRIFQSVPVENCCKGYIEQNDKCVPFCDGCLRGTCIAPGICKCHDNYGGANCDLLSCEQGFWGEICNRSCLCQNNATCDRVNGTCRCPAGFTGEQCEKLCPAGTYGRDCTEKCFCVNGDCSNVDGTCSCSKGWRGQDCSESACTPGFFGETCQKKCDCINENTESCHPLTGHCFCKPGWNNTDCSSQCNFPTYGIDCSDICECTGDNYAGCDPQTGDCVCKSGWKGDSCDVKCPLGNCKCAIGFQGLNCDEPCEEGYYGEECKEICLASGIHQLCNHVTGETTCADGYVGPYCENKCSEGKYGKDCKSNCSCKNNAKCNHQTGECTCLTGFMGEFCESICQPGFYGVNCEKQSHCSDCRPSDGFCRCQEGWNGTQCKEYCPESLFNFEMHECFDPYNTVNIKISHANTYNIYIITPVGIVVFVIVCFIVYKLTIMYKHRRRMAPVYSEVPINPKCVGYA